MIAMPKSHPMAKKRSVKLEELSDEVFLFNHDPMLAYGDTRDLQAEGFLKACDEAGFIPKIMSQQRPGYDFANIRDVAIESNNWVYPTFQISPWCQNENVCFVPIEHSENMAYFFFVTLEKKNTGADQMIEKCLKELFAAPEQNSRIAPCRPRSSAM